MIPKGSSQKNDGVDDNADDDHFKARGGEALTAITNQFSQEVSLTLSKG